MWFDHLVDQTRVDGGSIGAQPIVGATFCVDSIRDQGGPGCLEASSVPMLGLLYPISDKLFVGANGNVGIGTILPAGRLEVLAGGHELIVDAVAGSLPNVGSKIFSVASTSADGSLILEMQGGSAETGGILFRTGRTLQDNRMYIDNAGNVGIGRTTPDSLLHVGTDTAGSSVRVGPYAALGGVYSSWSTVLGDNVEPAEGQTDSMVFINTGSTYGGRAIRLNAAEGITFHGGPGPTTAGTPFNSELVRITNAGNIGIGTTSPSVKLEVVDTLRVSRPGNPQHYVELFGASSSSDPYINTAPGEYKTSKRMNLRAVSPGGRSRGVPVGLSSSKS